MSGGGTHEAPKSCGLFEILVFIAAIASGTACSVCSKTMMEMTGIGIDGNVEVFGKPIFQTFGMFVGMTFGLVMHGIVLAFKIPFPGYKHSTVTSPSTIEEGTIASETSSLMNKASTIEEEPAQSLPLWMYFFLAIPSVFDLGATVLCMMGLRYLDVSIYQLLRGSGIIFVALMKQHVLKDKLYNFQWLGVAWNVASVVLVGATAILNEQQQDNGDDDGGKTTSSAFLGVLLVMAGAVVQAMQFVFEEKVMTMDIPSPPLLLIGMEGFWGTVLCLVIVYPAAYFLPGDDHGSYEDPFNTWYMLMNSSSIMAMFWVYFGVIFAYNLFAVLVTFMLSSIWHAILDNFRPITVWITDLFIFYVIAVDGFGEPWTKWSYLQVFGMCILLYGTAIYNAPNSGSILLKGQWYAFGFDLSEEYDRIAEAEMDASFEERMLKHRKGSSFFSMQRSPHMSIHTQALHGLASPKI